MHLGLRSRSIDGKLNLNGSKGSVERLLDPVGMGRISVCVCVTRVVIVQALPLAVSGSVYPTQHNTTHARTRVYVCTERERERKRETARERERERARERERERRTHARTHARTHVYTVTPASGGLTRKRVCVLRY